MSAVRIIPYLVAILVAVGMFRAAGGIQMLAQWLAPVLDRIGFPADLLPVVLVRPLERQRDDRAVCGTGESARAGQLHRPHGGDDPGQHRDDFLRAGGLFRLRGHPQDAPRGAGRAGGGPDGSGGLLRHLPGCFQGTVTRKKRRGKGFPRRRLLPINSSINSGQYGDQKESGATSERALYAAVGTLANRIHREGAVAVAEEVGAGVIEDACRS